MAYKLGKNPFFKSRALFGVLVLSVFALLIVQTAGGAHPVVRNFSKKDYRADTQNWQICSDDMGRMLFANKQGLLIYDGNLWETFPLDNQGSVRSIAPDSLSKRIYVGGSGTFGYFEPDSLTGILRYHTLVSTLADKKRRVNNVWRIMRSGNCWWFQGDRELYRYDGRNTITLPLDQKISCSSLVRGSVMLAMQDGAIYKVSGTITKPVAGTAPLMGKNIRAILPHPTDTDAIMVVTALSGCFRIDANGTKHEPTPADNQLEQGQVFSATCSGSTVLFGTVNDGMVVIDFSTGRVTNIDKSSGLQNNTVLCSAFDSYGNIWLGLDNGLDLVLYNSPVKRLLPELMSCGAGYASLLWGNSILLGTNQGLYSVRYPYTRGEIPQRLLRGQVWSMTRYGSTIIVCSDLGVYAGRPEELKRVPLAGGAWFAAPLPSDSSLSLVSTYDSFHLISRDPAGTWKDLGEVQGAPDVQGHFKYDNYGNIWISNWHSGVYRLRLDPAARRFTTAKLFGKQDGSTPNENQSLTIRDNKCYVTEKNKVLVYDPSTDRFIPLTTKWLPSLNSGNIYSSPSGDIWSVSQTGIIRVRPDAAGHLVDSTVYNMIAPEIIPGFEHLNFLPDATIISAESGFYEIDNNYPPIPKVKPSLFISHIYLNRDSLIYAPGNSKNQIPTEIPYHAASVTFKAASPEYRAPDAVNYSFFLEGYDKEWSPFLPQSTKEYTRLGHGEYKLHVRAYNSIDDIMTEAVYSFTVPAPWYLSSTAILIYALLIIISLIFAIHYITRIIHRKAILVEKHKEEEIANMRREALEQQKSHQSESLSYVTKHAVNKNEMLLRISESVEHLSAGINATVPDNQAIASDLQSLRDIIRQSLQQREDITAITRNFDELYGDYVNRLTSVFPTLSKSEIRLCCYIKMGLSTKEIAPLLNVATKSIEMSRYRLRKKLGLERADNLTDFLQNF